MSLDDTENGEVELHELVTEVLEENGLLSKIRAQLRAGLYLALENDINETDNYTEYNNCLKSKLRDPDITLIFCLVREFLEYFELSCTLSVFDKETFCGSIYEYENREKLVEYLNVGLNSRENVPLLLQLLNLARCKYTPNADQQESTKIDDNRDAHNATYDVPSIFEKSNNEHSECSISESEAPQIIGVKTVLKENVLNKSNSTSAEENAQNGSEVSGKKELSGHKSGTKSNIPEDDTYEGTSSIAEDSIFSGNKEEPVLIDLEKSLKVPFTSANINLSITKTLIDQTLDDHLKSPKSTNSPDHSQPSSAEKKNHKLEKSDRAEKLKPMSTLSSLADLPPVQLNKNRNNDKPLLPSLYTKDFKDKSSLKEVDTLVEMNYDSFENYEEDFTSSGSLDNESLNNALNSKDGSFKSNKNGDSNIENISNLSDLSHEKIIDIKNNPDTNSNSVKSLTLGEAHEPSM